MIMNTDKQYSMNFKDPDVEFLTKTGRMTGMTVPEGFFAEFDKRIEAAIDAEEQRKLSIPVKDAEHKIEVPVPTQSNDFRRLWMGLAACVVVALCTLPFLRNTVEVETAQVETLAEMDEAPTQQDEYLCSSLSDFDMFDLYCEAL